MVGGGGSSGDEWYDDEDILSNTRVLSFVGVTLFGMSLYSSVKHLVSQSMSLSTRSKGGIDSRGMFH